MKYCLILIIKLYWKIIPASRRNRCLYKESCSNKVYNDTLREGLFKGLLSLYQRIKNLDARMGMCIDIGHSLRAGTLPEKAIRDFKDRVFDLHIKDIHIAAKEGKAIEVGRGVIRFDEVVESLRKIKYQGMCSIEFEKDMTDPLPGIAESVGYFKGIIVGSGE